METVKHTVKTIALLVSILGCSNNSEITQEEELRKLNNLKKEIEQLIAAEVCTENADCNYIAFGSKPCGGPWSYLVYSTSINVEVLQQKVEAYNTKENAYNVKWGIISDCSIVLPPAEVVCIDEKCVAMY